MELAPDLNARRDAALAEGFEVIDAQALMKAGREEVEEGRRLTGTLLNLSTGERVSSAEVRFRGDDLYQFWGLGKYDRGTSSQPALGYMGPWVHLSGGQTLPGLEKPADWVFKRD